MIFLRIQFTEKIMANKKVKQLKSFHFWENLREGYNAFEENRIPPNVNVRGGKYVFN